MARSGDASDAGIKEPDLIRPMQTTALLTKTAFALLLALLAATAQAEVRLSEVFGEHMVLQRDRPMNVWGHATPGQMLTVELAGRTASTRVGADGRWRVQLAALPAGG